MREKNLIPQENNPVYTLQKEGKVYLLEIRFRPIEIDSVKTLTRYDAVVDIGEAVKVHKNLIALQQGEGFQLYCLSGGKLYKGARCLRYIFNPGGFVYEVQPGEWYRSEHDCRQILLLGQFHLGGLWTRPKGKKLELSYYEYGAWVSRTYEKMTEYNGGPYRHYCFLKKNGLYDIILQTFNDELVFYYNISAEKVEELAQDPEARVDFGEPDHRVDGVKWQEMH